MDAMIATCLKSSANLASATQGCVYKQHNYEEINNNGALSDLVGLTR